MRWDVISLTFLLPLFFLPLTASFFEINKQVLLIVFVSFITITWAVRNILIKNVRFTLSPALAPLTLLTVFSLISLFTNSINRSQAFLSQPVNYLALLLFYILATTRLNKQVHVKLIVKSLTLSASVLSLLSIVSFAGLFSKIPNAPEWLTLKTFTPAGGVLPLLIFLVPIFFLTLPQALQKTALKKRLFSSLTTLLIATAIGISLVNIKQAQNLTLLPFSAAWEIALENFKTARTALFGQGPDGFITAFTNFKPIAFNRTDIWQLRFDVSRNLPLHLLTTIGIFGLISYLWLALIVFKSARKTINLRQATQFEKSLNLSLIIILISQFLFPISLLNLFLFIVLLVLKQIMQKFERQTAIRDVQLRLFAVNVVKPDQQSKKDTVYSEILPWIIGIPLSLTLIVGLYLGATRIYAAEISYKRSLNAAVANNGTQTYNSQAKAIQQDPKNPRYRTAFSLTNLALANSIAAKADLNQNDRQNITQLISQAIAEAKFATQLNPRLTSSWENLAGLYRNLIGVAEGSKDWSIAAYVQAIQTDPNNPSLRLQLGGIYFGAQEYEQAIRFFEQAVLLKPDWPNAHYNLAAAYRQQNDLQKAIEEMRLVLQLLDPASADFTKAQQELQTLNDQLGQTAQNVPPAESQLTPPQPLPTPAPQQIQLPEDSGPDVATQSAIPTPQVTPTPTPQP